MASGLLRSTSMRWRYSVALLLWSGVTAACFGQETRVSTDRPTEIRVRIMDSRTRRPLKKRKVQITFSGMDGQWYHEAMIMTGYTGPDGIAVFSVKQPVPPLMDVMDLAAYPCSFPEAFQMEAILENGVVASWPLSGIQKAERWCTPDSGAAEPQKRPGEVVFFVHPLNLWQNFWYTLLK